MLRSILLVSCLWLLASCSLYRDDNTSFVFRAQEFEKLLGEPAAVEALRQGKTDQVASHLARMSAQDPAWKARYEAILEREGIKLFTPAQVAVFYHDSVLSKLKK